MNALIIEDETAAATNLKALLTAHYPSIQIIAVLESITETVGWFSNHPMPDLAFMDIHLADGDAFEIFDRIDITCPVIFTTAYNQYALEAFQVNSIDYLLKPIKTTDLQRAIGKLERLSNADIRAYSQRVGDIARAHGHNIQRTFLVQIRDKIIPLPTQEIAYFYTSDEKVTATGFDGNSYPLDKSLETLSAQLPESSFYRANRQFIISRKAIKDISVWFGSRLCVNLDPAAPERIIVSKARAPEFKKWLSTGGIPSPEG